jgi:hypothetical protein
VHLPVRRRWCEGGRPLNVRADIRIIDADGLVLEIGSGNYCFEAK